MRRLLSILLLAVFGLPLFAPMLAMGQDSDAGLPACCRRNGRHHCAMGMGAGATGERGAAAVSHDPQWKAPTPVCPYCPAQVSSAQPNPLAVPTAAALIFGAVVSHPAQFAQTEARWRIALGRSNQKRGPPTSTIA